MVRWDPPAWAERTRLLDAAERGVLADLRNMMFLRMALACSRSTNQMAASMDTWAMCMRMSAEGVRKVFVGLEAAGVVRTSPKPSEAKKGTDVLVVGLVF